MSGAAISVMSAVRKRRRVRIAGQTSHESCKLAAWYQRTRGLLRPSAWSTPLTSTGQIQFGVPDVMPLTEGHTIVKAPD